MQALQEGWIPFHEFLKKYGIKKDGSESRKLKSMPAVFKQNVGTDSKRFWIVDESHACNRFKVIHRK